MNLWQAEDMGATTTAPATWNEAPSFTVDAG
jgi:hypothetical protein